MSEKKEFIGNEEEEAAAITACLTLLFEETGKNYYVKNIRRLKDESWVKHARLDNLNKSFAFNNNWR